MQISLTVTAKLRDERGMKASPYLAEIAHWPPRPWDLLSTSNHKDQGPATGRAHRGSSLGVGASFHLGAPPDIFLKAAFSFSRLTDDLKS